MGGGRIRLYVHVPFVMNGTSSLDVPLCAVFKVLRIDDIDEMVRFIEPDEMKQEFVRKALSDPCASWSRDQILDSLAQNGAAQCKDKNKRLNYILHIFKSEFLPHCGVDGVQYKRSRPLLCRKVGRQDARPHASHGDG